MLLWHAIITRPGREFAAKAEITGHGYEAYLPTMQRRLGRRAGGGLVNVARFTGWVFACFDAEVPGWEQLGQGRGHMYDLKVKCDSRGVPLPMPERAIKAMKAYKVPPPDEGKRKAPSFIQGAPVLYYIAGIPTQAIFVRHLKRGAQVELWILGRPRTVKVAMDSLEEIELV